MQTQFGGVFGSMSASFLGSLISRPLVSLIAATAVSVLLSACTKQEAPASGGQTPAVTATSETKASGNDVGKKVLRIEFEVGETGFDPVKVHDLYSSTVNDAIFEKLLAYDYLANPPKLTGGLAESLPVIENNGKTYTFKLRQGVYFAPDAKFNGQKREVTAQDVVYSIMRHIDEKNRPVWNFLVQGKIIGLDALAEEAKKTGKFNYDAKVEGLQAVDKYTVKIQLKASDYNFGYILAHTPFGIVAREVIEGYEDTNAHPVGTGAYMLTNWQRRAKMILEKNPNFRGGEWNFAPSADPIDAQLIAEMKGKKFPLIDRIEISIMEEEQARWLAFQNGELDVLRLPGSFAPTAIPGGKVSPSLAEKGVRLQTMLDPEVTYTYFNMKDPVWGGYTVDKIALRRAVAMSYNVQEEIDVIRKGQAVHAQYVIPPGVAGHDPSYKTSIQYDPDTANKLLDRFGYKKAADGYRTLPDGKPLVFKYNSDPSSISREFDELWKKSLDRIGIRFEAEKEKFADALKRERQCLLVTRGAAWIADYPDGDNFMMLLYGPNTGESNNACYQSAKYDALYKKTTTMPDGPERNAVYLEMHKVYEADTPWHLHTSRKRNQLIYPHVKGYKKHPILHAEWMYLDLEPRK